MAVTPHTQVYLLKCPLEADQLNQLSFSNATAQYNYFNSLPKVELFNFTYQRKDNVIRVPEHIDSILNYNYVMYRNDNYSNKWFYAFITGMEYSSDHMTYVSIKTDVFQTWQFNMVWKQSFVEREHVSNDTIGFHTVPEGLNTGEYLCSKVDERVIATNDPDSDNKPIIVMQVSDPYTNTTRTNGLPTTNKAVYAGVPSGVQIYGFDYTDAGLAKLNTTIGLFDGAGKADSIMAIFLAPKNCATFETKHGVGDLSAETWKVAVGDYGANGTNLFQIYRSTTLDGYTPKNNKMFTREFSYLYVTNNGGSDVVFAYEDFTGGVPEFVINYALDQGGAVRLNPYNSRKSLTGGEGMCFNEGVNGTKLPICGWNSDYYLNWKAQNGKALEVQAWSSAINFGVTTLGTMAGSTSPAGSSVTGLAGDVAQMALQDRQAKIVPDQAKGASLSGDLCFGTGQAKFVFRNMTVRNEYARIIDDYLTAFGYKVNTLKVPNITGRRNWNYVKTIGANIEGDIPQADIDELKAIFNTGVTIWHNPNTFLDYSQANNII